MRWNTAWSLAAGLGLTFALALSSTRAQGPPGGPGGGPGGLPSLIMTEPVQEDLALTDKQKAQIKKSQSSMMLKSREMFQAAREGGVEPEEMREAMTAINREHNVAVAKVLDKNQKARLAQIELQRDGLLAAAKSDIANKLKLNNTQTKKIKAIVEEMRQAQFRAMPPPPGVGGLAGGSPPNNPGKAAPKGKGGNSRNRRQTPGADGGQGNGDMPQDGGGFPGGGAPGDGGFFGGEGFAPAGMPDFNSEEFRAKMAKMMEEQKKNREVASKKIGEVLSPEQTAAFEKMLGKPFDFSKLNFGPPNSKPPEGEAPKAEEGTAKPGEETPKVDAPAKSQPKTKSRKSSSL
jgi:Spy/CpxP family protein refolding chaperone